VIGYQQPCRYCDEFIPPTSNVCPVCGKVNPLHMRCPRCRDLIRKAWTNCSNCGLELRITCPYCQETTFFGDYCETCDARLVVVCSAEKCGLEQPPIGDSCKECGKPLKTPTPGGGQ